MNFYRRRLPSICVDFSSDTGKTIFRESLLAGDANIYFKLAAQFRTQDEPAYCGLSTLVMVLNALDVDPGRVWKSPWRFYHESMLDCCISLDKIKKNGINLQQFLCLALCNRLMADVHYASSTDDYLVKFREDIQRCVRSDNEVIVVSYDRKVLGQTGSGHFSPLGAYHKDTDQVLIMDVARFKYPPHWVTVSLLRDAMLTMDKDTGKPRGYILIKLRDNTRPLIAVSLKTDIDARKSEFPHFLKEWNSYLQQPPIQCDGDSEMELKITCGSFERLFSFYVTLNEPESCDNGEDNCCMANELDNCCHHICESIRSTIFHRYIHKPEVVALLLAWPFEQKSERALALQSLVEQELKDFDVDSLNEIDLLRSQIKVVISECGTIVE